MPITSSLLVVVFLFKNTKLSATPLKWLRDPFGGGDPPVGNRCFRELRQTIRNKMMHQLI